jgi:glycosyltransferase involved in cell wall biosynthesis
MIYSETLLLEAVQRRVNSSEVLRPRVRLVGAVAHDQLAAFFSAADLYVGGSHHEGSGYALIEAIACGAVPVVSDIPTFRLLTGGAGALWPAGDAASFGRALLDVSRRNLDAERRRLADHFARELTWPAIGRRAHEIYGEIVGHRARR